MGSEEERAYEALERALAVRKARLIRTLMEADPGTRVVLDTHNGRHIDAGLRCCDGEVLEFEDGERVSVADVRRVSVGGDD